MKIVQVGNPFAVQQHLQGGTQGGEAKTLVFHFNDDRVVVGISNVGQEEEVLATHSPTLQARGFARDGSFLTRRWSKGDSNCWSHPHALLRKRMPPLSLA